MFKMLNRLKNFGVAIHRNGLSISCLVTGTRWPETWAEVDPSVIAPIVVYPPMTLLLAAPLTSMMFLLGPSEFDHNDGR